MKFKLSQPLESPAFSFLTDSTPFLPYLLLQAAGVCFAPIQHLAGSERMRCKSQLLWRMLQVVVVVGCFLCVRVKPQYGESLYYCNKGLVQLLEQVIERVGTELFVMSETLQRTQRFVECVGKWCGQV